VTSSRKRLLLNFRALRRFPRVPLPLRKSVPRNRPSIQWSNSATTSLRFFNWHWNRAFSRLQHACQSLFLLMRLCSRLSALHTVWVFHDPSVNSPDPSSTRISSTVPIFFLCSFRINIALWGLHHQSVMGVWIKVLNLECRADFPQIIHQLVSGV